MVLNYLFLYAVLLMALMVPLVTQGAIVHLLCMNLCVVMMASHTSHLVGRGAEVTMAMR